MGVQLSLYQIGNALHIAGLMLCTGEKGAIELSGAPETFMPRRVPERSTARKVFVLAAV